MLAVEALAMSMGIVGVDEALLKAGFDGGDAGRVLADRGLGDEVGFLGAHRGQLVLDAQQGEDQCHAHIHAELYLFEVAGTGITVHLGGDLVDAGQRMQHDHVRFGHGHLGRIQHINIL